MKILVATEKPFAAVAVEGIKKEIEQLKAEHQAAAAVTDEPLPEDKATAPGTFDSEIPVTAETKASSSNLSEKERLETDEATCLHEEDALYPKQTPI